MIWVISIAFLIGIGAVAQFLYATNAKLYRASALALLAIFGVSGLVDLLGYEPWIPRAISLCLLLALAVGSLCRAILWYYSEPNNSGQSHAN